LVCILSVPMQGLIGLGSGNTDHDRTMTASAPLIASLTMEMPRAPRCTRGTRGRFCAIVSLCGALAGCASATEGRPADTVESLPRCDSAVFGIGPSPTGTTINPDSARLKLQGFGFGNIRFGLSDRPPSLSNFDEVIRVMQRSYPMSLRNQGIGGTIKVWFVVDPEGQTQRIAIKEGSGHLALDRAAIAAANAMRFTVTRVGDCRAWVLVDMPIVFKTQ